MVLPVWARALDRLLQIGCHPAGAVALALRAGAPILATVAALDLVTPVPVHVETEPSLASWLARLRPEDFEAPSIGRAPDDA